MLTMAPDREALRAYYCHGCGRRLFYYTPDPLAPGKRMRLRCRCKTWNEVAGPEVLGALRAFTEPAPPGDPPEGGTE